MGDWIYYLFYFLSVALAACSQVLLKKSAQKEYDSKIKEYLNPLVLGAYSIFFFTTFMTIFAYGGVSLSDGPVIETTGYIHIALLSYIFLNEKITIRKALGTAMIVAGICVFTMSEEIAGLLPFLN